MNDVIDEQEEQKVQDNAAADPSEIPARNPSSWAKGPLPIVRKLSREETFPSALKRKMTNTEPIAEMEEDEDGEDEPQFASIIGGQFGQLNKSMVSTRDMHK